MINRAGSILAITICVLLQGQGGALGQAKEQNAAIKYLRADAALRQAYPLPPDARLKLEQALEKPIDTEDEKLVAAASEALIEFHHGAKINACDWEMSTEDGPAANTAHRGAMMELVAVSALRGRIRLRDADHQGAVADLLAGYAAARHLSTDGSIASVLFGYRIERELTGVLQNGISLLTPVELAELESGLTRLPQGSNMQTAVEAEKLKRNELMDIVGDAHTRDDLITRMATGIPALGGDRSKAQTLVDGCGGSVSGVVNCIEKQNAFYKKWIAKFGLPLEDFQREYEADYAKASTENPILHLFTPNLPRLRWAEAYNNTRRALLRAAVVVQRGGPGELSRYPDPFNGKPFTYTPLANGFRLESSLKENDKPLSIMVAPL